MGTSSTRQSVLDTLDPLRLLHSGPAKGVPAYQTNAAQAAALSAGQLGQQISGGTNQVPLYNADGSPKVDAYGNPIYDVPRDANGAPVQGVGDGSGQSVAQQLYGNIGQTAALDPSRNAALTQASGFADQAASGQTGQLNSKDANGLIAKAVGYNQGVSKPLAQQAQDLGIVRDSAEGKGPSAAENLARAQLDANIRSQSAMAATARGGNVAAAMRAAAASGTQQSLQTAQQIATQRAQEQLNAQQLLTSGNNALTAATQANADQLGQLSGQKVALANTNAGLLTAGLSGQLNAAGQFAQDTNNQVTAQQAAQDQWADYLQKQYSLSSGIPVGFAGSQASVQNNNANLQQQSQGATAGAIGGLLAKLI